MIRFIITFGFGIFVGMSYASGDLKCWSASQIGCQIGSYTLSASGAVPTPARWNEPQPYGPNRATSDPVPLHVR